QPEMVIRLSAVPGSGMVTLLGLVPEQLPPPVTVSVYGVLWVAEVPVPVIVIGYVPAGVVVLVVIVMVDEPPELTDGGWKEGRAPLGRPDADKVIVCAEPLVSAVLTVALTAPPGAVEPEVGATEMEKSFVTHEASLPATLTAVQAACTVLYSLEHSP